MANINIAKDRFLVFGAGVSGRSALKLLTHLGANATIIEGSGPDIISDYDVLILSPGIPRTHKLVQLFLSESKPVLGELELASRFIKTPIICVTGSNGKTTVCTMIAEFLEQLGKNVFLGGNIGTPLSEAAIKESEQGDNDRLDYIVCEASSFQLESLSQFQASIGAILNLSFTHQERYENFDEYIKAKLNLFSHSEKCLYASHAMLESSLGTFEDKLITFRESYQYGYEFMQLVGEHNKRNFESCFQILRAAGVDFSDKQAQAFIQNFQAPAFRVQKIAVAKNLIFYNDSKSTNLDSTLAAIKCFDQKNLVLIIGGKVRDASVDQFSSLADYPIELIYSFGETSEVMKKNNQFKKINKLNNLNEVFDELQAYKFDESKIYHIVFSPGFPSFDQYRNYIERGEHFNRLVERVTC